MSTRATIHFLYSKGDKPTAIIYRHCDGYPNGLGKDLKTFIKEVRDNVPDNRFDDAAYLAAKWVAWDTRQAHDAYNRDKKLAHYLDFLGVGILNEDPGDIEYRYTVVCDGKPTISCKKV